MKRRYIKIGLLLGIALVVFVLERRGILPDMSSGSSSPAPTSPAPSPGRVPAPSSPATSAEDSGSVRTTVDTGGEAIAAAFRARTSGIMVEAAGEVDRVLPDDTEGSPHQRFVVRLDGGLTVLIAHNLDLASRVPLREGEPVVFRGQYEWNERGGVVHWTHHDPQARREGGWIEHEGRRYQ